MIKLKDILFEAVVLDPDVRKFDRREKSILLVLGKAFKKKGNDFIYEIYDAAETKAGKTLSAQDVARKLYLQNKSFFDKILGQEKFGFVGAGSYGLAFSVGNRILKLETKGHEFSTSDRTEMSVKALGGLKKKEQKLGSAVPAIYDSGTTSFFGVPVFWVIMERFESSDIGSWEDLIGVIIRNIRLEIDSMNQIQPTKKEINRIARFIRKKHTPPSKYSPVSLTKMEEELRLASDWLEKLIQDMIILENKSREGNTFNTDFHAGNIGIRRTGAEGYFKFFD
mgnify:CR=1 FL=1